jgi:hypothetical protein
MNKRDNVIKWSIISIFVSLYIITSLVSTIHVIDFFRLSNPNWLAVTLAIAFEIGAAASLSAIIILDKTSRWLIWTLFILITTVQILGNMYYAYTHLKDYQFWSELFGINEEEPIFQKRILSVASGAILPIVALGFIKSLVDYIRPSKKESSEESEKEIHETIEDIKADENLSEREKTNKIEHRIKKALINNPELKEKMVAEIKRIEDEDKYPKSQPTEEPQEVPRKYGAM